MKQLKKILRLCALVLFMLLAVSGISLFGVAPMLSKDNKLFADTEVVSETVETGETDNTDMKTEKDVKF